MELVGGILAPLGTCSSIARSFVKFISKPKFGEIENKFYTLLGILFVFDDYLSSAEDFKRTVIC